MRRRRPGVADHVRDRLLADAVRGQLDARGQRALRALDRGLDVQTGGLRLLRQLVDARQAGRGRLGRHVVRLAQRVEHAAQLGQGVAAGMLDRLQRRARLLGPVVEQVQGRARLHVDQRDVVRQHVVEVARDREALLAAAASDVRLARPLGLGLVRAPDADGLGRRDEHEHPGRERERLADRRRRLVEQRRLPPDARVAATIPA